MFEQISIFEMLNPIESRFTSECRKGSGFEDGRVRIYFASRYLNVKEFAGYLKIEYGIGGWTSRFPDGGKGYTDHNSSGLTIHDWITDESEKHNWSEVAKEIKRLIAMDDYLTAKDKQKINELEKICPVQINEIHPHYKIGVVA